ncbi:MAG: hypothetical protein KF730_08580 [Sphingomonas sp.]|uniref:hypothetical protein n=1 Tax=Sphingomonas sp. TaxID=28214 RepID=UPI0025EF1ED3|nr:hypothetical protein [Sphingomonas sp.]MBX3564615.1 hypothetical protein [Sphingomonas sp.]
MKLFGAAIILLGFSQNAFAQNSQALVANGETIVAAETSTVTALKCLPETKTVHEVVAFLGRNDFSTLEQDSWGANYIFNACLTKTARVFLHGGYAKITEPVYQANSVSGGFGVEFRPSEKDSFTIIPSIYLARERSNLGIRQTVVAGAFVAADSIGLRTETWAKTSTRPRTTVNLTQLDWSLRVQYANRDPDRYSRLAGATSSNELSGQVYVGIDQAVGRNWRSKIGATYQRNDGKRINSVFGIGIAARAMSRSYNNYHVNFAVDAKFGNRGYRGLLFSVSVRP